MKAKIKKLWVDALRSGNYKQTTGELRNVETEAFCCLGVLCNLHAQAHPAIAARQKRADRYMGEGGVLPDSVATWAGLKSVHGDLVKIESRYDNLTDHNDEGKTFKQIAKAIEEQL